MRKSISTTNFTGSFSEDPKTTRDAPSPSSPVLVLSALQHERLADWRAWWDESEERYRHWEIREADEETAERFRDILRETDFAQGGTLTPAQRERLCGLARHIAPNRNLDRRLYTGAGEPAAFDRDLRTLLYGTMPMPERLLPFLKRRGVGQQTVSQWLCLAFPTRFPLLWARALKPLDLTREQEKAAHSEALSRFTPSVLLPELARLLPELARLLRDLVVYERVRESLDITSYLEVYRILRHAPAEARLLKSERPLEEKMEGESGTSMLSPVSVKTPERRIETVRERRAVYLPRSEKPSSSLTETELLASVEAFLNRAGFTYPPLTVRNYYVALKTKPFALLCGISGTGKTRLTHLFADALTGDTRRQYRLIPVRPDWTDSTPLLGYRNLLAGTEGQYVSTRFLDFLRLAGLPENAARAYFLCLDEMNLARVEHYFAEFLSAMETPEREIALPDSVPNILPISPNLFVTGSLNVDETTFALSRKVLDRANTLEFAPGDLTPLTLPEPTQEPVPDYTAMQRVFLTSRVRTVADALRRLNALDPAFVPETIALLNAINTALAQAQLPFGYRIRDEVLMYLANSFSAEGRGLFAETPARNCDIALDFQIVQKILPRLSGAQETMESALRALLALLSAPGASRFSRAQEKLTRMLRRVQRDGYVHFYEG